MFLFSFNYLPTTFKQYFCLPLFSIFKIQYHSKYYIPNKITLGRVHVGQWPGCVWFYTSHTQGPSEHTTTQSETAHVICYCAQNLSCKIEYLNWMLAGKVEIKLNMHVAWPNFIIKLLQFSLSWLMHTTKMFLLTKNSN